MHMSYAVPEVRQRVLDILREAVEMCDPEGVGLLFVRGMPLMLWEPAFCERFSAEYGADAKAVDEEDPRIHALRGKIMTELFRELRSMLDGLAKEKTGRRYTISAATFSEQKSNERFGLDVGTWVKEELVDELAIAYHAHHTGFVPP
nr:hypothetical protein [Verrucomicrobiota bacterium]